MRGVRGEEKGRMTDWGTGGTEGRGELPEDGRQKAAKEDERSTSNDKTGKLGGWEARGREQGAWSLEQGAKG